MAIGVPAKRRWWTRQQARADGAPAASTAATTAASARMDAATVARVVIATGCFGAAAIHFAFAPDHYAESRFHGAFFFLAGWVQLGLGTAILVAPTRTVLRAVIAVNAGLVLLWVVSRVSGMPFGDEPWVAEPIAFPDVLATVLEVMTVGAGYVLLSGRLATRSVSRTFAVAGGALLAVVLVGVTTASVAPALAGDHSHGAGGHASGHAAASGSGSGGGHSHGEVAAGTAAGIETASGTSPCEQSGASIDGGGGAGGHGHRGPAAQQSISDPTVRAALGEQLEAARGAAVRFPTAADATAAGYRKVTDYLPCIAAHYMRFSFVDGTFDPSAPEMLLYDGDGPDARIVGLSYYVAGTAVAPEGFAGPNDPWHQHIGLCIRGGLVVGATSLSEAECSERGGTRADGSASWMVHAWVVPGWESAWGTFSAEHPELGTSVRH